MPITVDFALEGRSFFVLWVFIEVSWEGRTESRFGKSVV